MNPVIVHLSGDYPDRFAPGKTCAVANLVEGTPEFRHVVYSLNRVNGWSGLRAETFGEDRTQIVYGALPAGLLWEKRLPDVARWILADLRKRGIVPDLVQAHKFTVEGVIGLELARAFSCPLVCDIQGHTDVRILKVKRGFRRRYREIAQESAVVFPYAPWPVEAFEKGAGLDRGKCRMLPVVPNFDALGSAPVVREDKLLSVFHLDGWKNKNFEGMVRAVKILAAKRPGLILDIYGGGRPETLRRLQEIIAQNGMEKHVVLKGPVENGALPEVMRAYAGFVLPSRSESYGLVYAEALFAGLPVLFNKRRGISGYFEPARIGYACDASLVEDIAAGMDYLLAHQESLKENIARMQAAGDLDMLRKGNILDTYRAGIAAALVAPKKMRREDIKLCFAASGGGHLRQLLQLAPLRERFSCYYLTEDTPLGESVARDHKTLFVPHFAFGQRKTEGLWPFIKSGAANFFVSSWCFLKERPDVIISTGAGAAFFTLLWGRVFGRKIVYIESIARVTEVSLFGKLAARLAGLCIVQWPSMVGKLEGAVYCSPLVVEEEKEDGMRAGTLVTVGTVMPFDRMVHAVGKLARERKIQGPVAAQIGESEACFEGMDAFGGCPFEELNARMEAADMVICHGGSGSILGALKAGAHVVAMPRKAEFGEHYDDHQQDITKAFADMGLISVANSDKDLLRAIEEAKSRPRKRVNIDPSAYLAVIGDFVLKDCIQGSPEKEKRPCEA